MDEKLDKIIDLLSEIACLEKIPYKSSGNAWSEAEETRVLKSFEEGFNTAKIAIMLDEEFQTRRSVYAIHCKIKELYSMGKRESEQYLIKYDETPRRKRKSSFKPEEDCKPIMDSIYDEPPF